MNAVLIAVTLMLALSLSRIHVVVSILISAVVGGLVGGLELSKTIAAFNGGLGGGAGIALSYALLGAFALALAESGLPHAMADGLAKLSAKSSNTQRVKWGIVLAVLALAISSQNILPIHIAFIPLVIPPLLFTLAQFKVDRRLLACVMTFGLITPYMLFPVGFGEIFLTQILLGSITKSGLDVSQVNVMHAMALPALGMVFGLLTAVFVTYRKPRQYNMDVLKAVEREDSRYTRRSLSVAALAMVTTFIVQLCVDSMLLGALAGFTVCVLGGAVPWRQADSVFSEGMKMMAGIGLIMIAASGMAEVLKATGDVGSLVTQSADLIGNSKALAAFLMLLVGLVVTLGIGSSFSTVPILATIYVPLAMQLGFSPEAIVCLVGTAGALGDAGSPASDSTLGPTAGLNVDGQHNHIWDTSVPTFLHFNLPLMAFGWVAVMVL
ncbi:Na+/H+ antiporter family protein [Deefgea salmonis]|uniref:Sodium:proton antiporter n=1 Tax=Deefgea salmonis TaxID=2875502 RepID=A0ABS8BMG3_9NEIS|nr:Na+/H+ antiporter NhaC family protein [Deefgea salmonis]MCB5196914.1 sodium:proton antiporter [Deefgea salmonis]